MKKSLKTNRKLNRSIGLLFFFLVLFFNLKSISSFGQCVNLTPVQMSTNDAEFPDGERDIYNLPDTGVFTLPPGAAVTGIKILPPTMGVPAEEYVPGINYEACIDAGAGSGSIYFKRGGIFAIRIERIGGANDTIILSVDGITFEDFARGSAKKFPCPTPPVSFTGTDVVFPTLNFAGTTYVSGVNNLIAAIKAKAAAAGGPIDVVINDHGKPGQLLINGQPINLTTPTGIANFKKFCALKGKIKSLTLISCSTAHGAAGVEFMKKLSECLGGIPVTAFTGTVGVWHERYKPHPNKTSRDTTYWAVMGKDTTITSPVQEVQKPNNLLPPQGPYKSPHNVPTQFPNNIAIRNISHDNFSPVAPPPSFNNTQDYTFNGSVQFDLTLNGGANWQPVTSNAFSTVSATFVDTSETVEYYDTEMNLLNIQGGMLPPNVRIRESPTIPSLGHHEMRPLTPMSGYGVSSYFDIFIELSLDGGQTWMPAQSGPTNVILQGSPTIVSAIPTLGEWGLIALTILILSIGVVFIKRT